MVGHQKPFVINLYDICLLNSHIKSNEMQWSGAVKRNGKTFLWTAHKISYFDVNLYGSLSAVLPSVVHSCGSCDWNQQRYSFKIIHRQFKTNECNSKINGSNFQLTIAQSKIESNLLSIANELKHNFFLLLFFSLNHAQNIDWTNKGFRLFYHLLSIYMICQMHGHARNFANFNR